MAVAAVNLTDLRPFLAAVLLEATGRQRGRELLRRVTAAAQGRARRSTDAKRRRILQTSEVDEAENVLLQSIIYRESSAPAWLAEPELENIEHQLLVVAVRGKHVIICASDGAMRERVVKDLKIARRLPRDDIAAFVGSDAKALWLDGVHTPTASKADTKMVTGTSLEHSLDPIGDQTYYLSAARSVPNVPGLERADKKPVLVGASPTGSRIWVKRSDSWAGFKSEINAILDHLASGKKGSDAFGMLAKAIDEPKGVGQAFAITLVPPELLSEEDLSAADQEAARMWAYDADFSVITAAGLSLAVKPSLQGNALGTIQLDVTLIDGAVSIIPKWTDEPPGLHAERLECARLLSDPARVKIYYESGHTIAQGRCYEGSYTDQPFPWSYHDFAGYNVCQEKPVVPNGSTLAVEIAEHGDNSLFAFVVERMFLGDDGKPKGWLASDDGSMELADFIHLDPAKKSITLVHVKASGSKDPMRGAAPAEYEVVVGQAVKNLRHLDRRNLVEELTKGKAKKIGAAVWHNGARQADRTGFLKAAKKLGASATKTLVVLQPRITKTEVTACDASGIAAGRLLRLRQVNTLMLASRSSALNCGATFVGMADTI